MAILKNTILAASVLASSALAVPVAGMYKRDMIMQTHTETVWQTVNQQATVWVDGSGRAVRTDFPTGWGDGSHRPAFTGWPGSWGSPGGSWGAPSASSAPAAAVPSPSAPAPSAPAPAPSAPAAAPSVPSVAPAPSFSAVAPSAPSAAVVPSSAAPVPAAPTPSSSAMPQTPSSGSGSSSGGPCQGQGSGCSGDITHWDGGLGACGWNVNTNSDMQVALPYQLMGTASNNNPYCGRSLTIQGPSGNLVQATVGDKCMGCTGDSIDLTNALFTAVAPSGDGRVHGISWWFN